jgi:ABC-type lipoprotein release transport system permease subunit
LAVLALLLRAQLRHRWRSWLLLSLLIALVSGVVLATASAGSRTARAFPGYDAAHGYDAFFYSERPLPRVAELPEVRSAAAVGIPLGGQPTCDCSRPINSQEFGIFEVAPPDLPRLAKLVAGRMPNQSDPDQVLASFTLQRDDGVHLGTVIRVPFASPAQRSAALGNGSFTPHGPTVDLRVVGIEASETEFPNTNTPSYDLYTTQAFAREDGARSVTVYAYLVRLRHGAADLPRFETRVRALGALSVTDLDTDAKAIELSIHPQAVGWWILAGLAALVGVIVITQALARQAAVESDTFATLSALGLSRRRLVALGMARALLIGVVGALGGVLLAFALSPLTPVGEARLAEPALGFVFDPLVLLSGAAATVVVVLVLAIWPAVRTARTRPSADAEPATHPSRVVSWLVRVGAPPSVVVGVRHALERGSGRGAVPVGTALVGSVLAVTALCGTAVFGASLTHLTSTPALYGQSYDLTFGINTSGTYEQAAQMLTSLDRARALTNITAGVSGDVTIDGRTVDALAGQSIRGGLLITTDGGRSPAADDEVVLGRTTLRQVGAYIGSTVRVTAPGAGGRTRTRSYRVVGTAVTSTGFGTAGLGSGAIFTLDGLLGVRCPPGPRVQACVLRTLFATGGSFLVKAEPGAGGRAALTRLTRAYPSEAYLPAPPTNLVNFGQAVNFPLLFGLVLIIFGVATLLHVLVVSVVRRRREVGLLKALGFVRRQVALSVTCQTTTVALVGIVVGIPLGIVVGRWVWGAFAGSLGVVPVTVIAGWTIAAVAVGALLVANLLAVGPALVAARSRPASLLKVE